MKKFILPVLFQVTLFSSGSFGQISVSLSDMIQLGDTVTRYTDTMTTMTAGPVGANQSWIMTSASIHVTAVTRAIAPSATPYGSSYTNSNLAMTNDNLSYLYVNQNSSTSVVKGAAGDLLMTGCNISTPFNPDMLLHNFPRNYGSNFSDNYGVDVTTSGSCVNQPVDQVRYKRVSTVYDTADGWGVITTPVGKYQCLRIRRVDFSTDTTWVKVFPFSPWSVATTKVDTAYSYSWVSKEGKLAIAELANDSLDNPKRYTWSQIAPFTAVISASSDATCNATCNGQATVAASGLYTPYSYAWTSGETTASATALCAGANSVTVTDNLGNSKIVSVTITEPAALALTTTSTDASGATSADGTASVVASGGTSPYAYLWSNGATSASASGLVPGSYNVTVTDGSGCTANGSVTINFSVGISFPNLNEPGHVFPNPSSDKIYFSEIYEGAFLTIFDVTGRILENTTVKKGNLFMDVSDYKRGIYFYQLKNAEEMILNKGKFVIER